MSRRAGQAPLVSSPSPHAINTTGTPEDYPPDRKQAKNAMAKVGYDEGMAGLLKEAMCDLGRPLPDR
jgi:hypothetical protein